VNRKLQIAIIVLVLSFVGLSFSLLAVLRVKEARHFSQSHRVQTATGTNYIVQLLETTVGKVETGSVVIVYARFENPNSTELVLSRASFVLIGPSRFMPVTSGTQTALIKLPPNGVLEKEALSYAVTDDSFAGTLALEVGHDYTVLVKNEKPWTRRLSVGKFVTFRSRDW
jgi:hypothetical protein